MGEIQSKEKIHSYVDTHKSINHGDKYDNGLYNSGSFYSCIWGVEKNILRELLKDFDKNSVILDFACGTGRVASWLEYLDYKDVHGFDVSEEMLKVAKAKTKKTDLIQIDINKENIARFSDKFDCIISFRFFLNAEHDLRVKTFGNIHRILKENGCLIFNIHGNKNSIRIFRDSLYNLKEKLSSLIFKREYNYFKYRRLLSPHQIKWYLSDNDFEIIDVLSYSFLTKFFYYFLPVNVFINFEKKLVSKGFLLGTHLIFVCRKKSKVEF